MLRKVFQLHKTTFAFYKLDNGLGNPSLIITRLSFHSERPESLRKAGIFHDLARTRCPTIEQHLVTVGGGILNKVFGSLPSKTRKFRHRMSVASVG